MKKIISLIALILYSILIFTSCGQEVFTGPAEESPSVYSKYFIKSNPSGAKIFLNGKNSGLVTPAMVNYLDPFTSYQVTLKLDLFPDNKFVILTLGENNIDSIFYDYYDYDFNFGKLSFISSPSGAEILINNQPSGMITPSIWDDVIPGDYMIKYKFAEHRDDSALVTARGGQIIQVSFALEDTSVFVSYQRKNSPILSNYVANIEIDNNNNLWIATKDRGLSYFDRKNWTNFTSDNSGLPYNFINTLNIDNSGRVWVGTSGALGVLQNGSWQIYNSSNSILPSNNIITSFYDKENNILYLGTEKGLISFDGNTFSSFNSEANPINGKVITAISKYNNQLWIGTAGDGIYNFINNAWNHYSYYAGELISNDISTSAISEDGTVYFGFIPNDKVGFKGGVMYFNEGVWTKLEIPLKYELSIQTLSFDDDNSMWIGTRAGALEIENMLIKNIYDPTNSDLFVSDIRFIKHDQNGDVWFGTFGAGISKFKR